VIHLIPFFIESLALDVMEGNSTKREKREFAGDVSIWPRFNFSVESLAGSEELLHS
jgi:hypothetical protein